MQLSASFPCFFPNYHSHGPTSLVTQAVEMQEHKGLICLWFLFLLWEEIDANRVLKKKSIFNYNQNNNFRKSEILLRKES